MRAGTCRRHVAVPLVFAGLLFTSCSRRSQVAEQPDRWAKRPTPDSARVVARFVGIITDEPGLPERGVRAIPVGYDPNFVLSIQISRLVSGKVAAQDGAVHFLIHSPTLFFVDNLGAPPDGAYPQGPFLFTLLATGSPAQPEYDLRMTRVDQTRQAGSR